MPAPSGAHLWSRMPLPTQVSRQKAGVESQELPSCSASGRWVGMSQEGRGLAEALLTAFSPVGAFPVRPPCRGRTERAWFSTAF